MRIFLHLLCARGRSTRSLLWGLLRFWGLGDRGELLGRGVLRAGTRVAGGVQDCVGEDRDARCEMQGVSGGVEDVGAADHHVRSYCGEEIGAVGHACAVVLPEEAFIRF